MSGSERWREELDVALNAAWTAGRVTLRWFQADPAVERKRDGSPVTMADREAERAMRRILESRFPDDGILGEEGGETRPGASRRWVLDPIDGTRSFIHGVPLYGVMVGLEVEGEATVGVLHFPGLGETVAAARGLGCRWDGRACRVSTTARLDRALVLTSGDARPGDTTPPADAGGAAGLRAQALQRLAARADTFRTWGDCYGYALVATGRAEAMLDPSLHLWDAVAVRPVIEEAGGIFTDWAGEPSHRSGHAVATNELLAAEVRRILAE